ncbi:MAG: type I polyketide synthase, partial [Geodermatophilaceae bacterium]|nr:type I polyketide synthase [Geodermatophilaceae bacterium]
MSEPREHNDAVDPAVEPAPGCDIAIVGMSGRFPGARDVAELWANIRAGASGITRFGDAELRAAGVPERLLADPGYVKAGAVLDGIDLFDASFFGVGPKEAQILDPQHRLFLEHSWQALEDAGCDPSRLDGTVGVFGGSAWSSYLSNNVAPSGVGAVMGELAVGLANDKDSLTTRVAHTLGLSGPTYGIQSYCSTSLVAVCAAASSLAGMECDLALAGGVAVAVPHRVGYLYQQGGIAPPDAECRAFDAAGLGSPVGSGVGVVVLRRLEDALADGDQVYAVIRGWAVNNDGGRKVGFTAPGVQGQAEVIAEALSTADLAPSEIDYIEAHGTGTALGDAAELAALQQVFRGESCLIGSIKTNVGHLDRAAGVTGLIKAALALRHEEIPPTRGLRTLNPQLKTGAASLEVVTELTDWPRRSGRPRRAGVSAFGIGGTNAHVVLQEAPRRVRVDGPARPELLVWSARDAEAADAMTDRLAAHLDNTSDGLGDVAYTLQVGRRLFEHRRMTVAESVDAAVAGLRGVGVRGRREAGSERGVAFLIAGTGEQYAGMAADLYRSEPLFREILDECRDGLAPRLGFDPLEDMLRPREAVSAGGAGLSWLLGRETAAADAGQATDRLQPATFAVEYALARLLTAWGVEPAVMAGYSLGEYVAACLSGVLSLDAALALVARRAQLIAGLPAGAMAAVPLSAEEVEDRISRSGGSLDIAALNGPKLTVVAGPPAEVHRFREFLEGEATPCRPLSTSHAFHSRMLEPIRDELTAWVRANVTVGTPRLPYLSNVTGELVTAKQLADPGYWAEHMCAPVRFDAALGGVLERGDLAVVEIGPGQSLGAMLRGRPDCPRERWPLVMPSLPAAGETSAASTVLIEAVGRLWLAGVPVDWAAFQADRGLAKVHVPGYPLRRQRYWIDPPQAAAESSAPILESVTAPAMAAVPTGIRPDHVRLVTPVWSELPLAAPAAEKTPIVLLADTGGVGVAVADLLGANGADVRLETVPDDPAELVARLGTEPATVVDLRLLDRAEDDLDG